MISHLVEWYTDIYMNVYGVDTTYTDIILKFNRYLKKLVNTTTFETFSNIILVIGVTLILYHFFSDLTEKAADKQLSPLIMGKSFCILFGTVFILFHTKELFIFLLRMIEGINSDFGQDINKKTIITDFFGHEAIQIMLSNCVDKYFSIFAILGYTLTALVIMIASTATSIFITYYSATRVLQLFVYYIFAPIGVSDIFENGPGAQINYNSSGFRYVKTIMAIMMQILVISAITHTYSQIPIAMNQIYFEENDIEFDDGSGDEDVLYYSFIHYPIWHLEYTNHTAPIRDLFVEIGNNIFECVKELAGFDEEDGDEGESTTGNRKEVLKDEEIHEIEDLLNNDYRPDENNEVIKDVLEKGSDSDYRMTIDSTELFFDWVVGSNGSKIVVIVMMLIVKVLMIVGSSRLCNTIMGVSI